jgi:hypothetical protein
MSGVPDMKTKLLLAAAIAAISLGAGAAQAQPGNAGSVDLAPSGIAVEEAKVSLHLGFGYPYYYKPYYYSPYYAPYYYAPQPQPYQGPYQYCHLGVCY